MEWKENSTFLRTRKKGDFWHQLCASPFKVLGLAYVVYNNRCMYGSADIYIFNTSFHSTLFVKY